MIDIRDIDEAYFNTWQNYTNEEEELFKTPTQFKHFKHRIELLIKRDRENRLLLLPQGDGDLLLALKLYVLNLIPTRNRELTSQIYSFLYDTFGEKGLRELIERHAKYLELFKEAIEEDGK